MSRSITVRVPDDVAALIDAERARTQGSISHIVVQALRRDLRGPVAKVPPKRGRKAVPGIRYFEVEKLPMAN